MPKPEITVRVTHNFGNRMVYPACSTSEKLAELARTKTFTDKMIAVIRELGYTIHVETPKV